MLRRLIDWILGCRRNLGWPRTSKHSSTGLYRVCLCCGREHEVDVSTWKPTGKRHVVPSYTPFDGAALYGGWVRWTRV